MDFVYDQLRWAPPGLSADILHQEGVAPSSLGPFPEHPVKIREGGINEIVLLAGRR
jgi:hypothetical protein